jgi:enoyl-CoA hydratase
VTAVLVEARGNVLVITIDRPEARNAVNGEVAQGLAAALDRLDAEAGLSVGVLTGGGGTFCSGMDLKGFLRGESPVVEGRGFGGLTQAPPRKPLIAAVEGWALAGGFEMLLACDLVVAATDAKFGIPEVKRSLVAGAGGLLRLPKRLPYFVAMEMALTGDPLTAEVAHRHGLVNRLVEPGQALEGALALAAAVAANGALGLAATKEIVRGSLDWSEQEGWKRQDDIMLPVFGSQDAREGAAAFAEKRAPRWQGK